MSSRSNRSSCSSFLHTFLHFLRLILPLLQPARLQSVDPVLLSRPVSQLERWARGNIYFQLSTGDVRTSIDVMLRYRCGFCVREGLTHYLSAPATVNVDNLPSRFLSRWSCDKLVCLKRPYIVPLCSCSY